MIMGLSDNIKVKLGTEKDCVQSVSVELPHSRVKASIDKAFLSVQNQAKLPGFRAGKTPLDLVRKNFKDTAYARAQDNLLREGVSEAIQLKSVKAIQPPIIESIKFDPDKSFQFEFKVEVAPQFKLSSYKGIKIAQKETNISEADVKKRLEEIAEGNAKLVESKSEKVEKAHFANINYEGFMDGKPIEGTKADNFLMDLSAPQTISGLSDGLIGAKVGEEREISVKFPEDSPVKNLAGKDALFKVTINAIKEKHVPTLNDDFAKDLGLSSLDEMKSKVQENMEKESKQKIRKETEDQIIDKLLADNKFSVPKSLLEKQSKSLVQKQQYRLAQQGYPEKEQEKILEGMKPQVANQSERYVRLAYILNQISDQEKINVTDEELKAKINAILSEAKPAERDGLEKLLNGTYREQIRSELKDGKIFDWLIESAKIKSI